MVVALCLSIPVSAAADDSEITIRSGDGTPGSTVTVTTSGCGEGETYGKGQSELAGDFHMFEGDREGELKGEFTLPDGVEAGEDTVTVKCPPLTKLTGTYQIGYPNGSVDAGFGDSSDRTTQLAVGSALLAAAATGAVVTMRRRRSDT
ncbi:MULTISPECIES: sortase [Streptomyces]|uniref:sortase n=1 Tax=Streptomyces TaxID=1883 RepID=UPI001F388810|nr:sortase [Streptomyces sp. AS58]